MLLVVQTQSLHCECYVLIIMCVFLLNSSHVKVAIHIAIWNRK